MQPGAKITPLNRGSGFTLSRVEEDEWLDSGVGLPRDVAANLGEMWRINRDLGGFQALTRHLYPRLKVHGDTTLLDLGTGGAEALVTMTNWARRRHLNIRVMGADWSARNLKVARVSVAGYPEIHLLQADANALPYASNSVDLVISSLFLHHFSPEQIISLLRNAYRCARHGLIMTDLVRGRLHLMSFKLVQSLYARNYLTRHDGALSIRRAYTAAELCELAQAAGIPEPRVHEHWPWRMTLVADK